jgi:hypothetical protein
MTTGQVAAERLAVIVGDSADIVGHRRLSTEVVHRAQAAGLSGASGDTLEWMHAFPPALKEVVAGPLVFLEDAHVTYYVGQAVA